MSAIKVVPDLNKICLQRLETRLWRVWLPHSCSPLESTDPDVPHLLGALHCPRCDTQVSGGLWWMW